MKLLVFFELACPSGNTAKISDTTPPASPPLPLWIGCTSCSVATAILAPMSPGNRRCSSWRSSWRTTWSKMWRVAGALRIWRTTTCCTGRQNFGETCCKIPEKEMIKFYFLRKTRMLIVFSHAKLCSPCPLSFPRFPTTSPLKPIPCAAPASARGSVKKRPSFRDKEGFFRFRSIKKHEKETQVSWSGCELFCQSSHLYVSVWKLNAYYYVYITYQ